MPGSDVRDIEALQALRLGLLKLGDDWDKVLQEVRMVIQRTEDHFSNDRVGYWRQQIRLAERELNEARDSLSQKRSAVRASDRPAATEAAKRVSRAERRLRTCESKYSLARTLAIEMVQQCDVLRGPLADVCEQCEGVLPAAAEELKGLIEHLRRYAEKGDHDNSS